MRSALIPLILLNLAMAGKPRLGDTELKEITEEASTDRSAAITELESIRKTYKLTKPEKAMVAVAIGEQYRLMGRFPEAKAAFQEAKGFDGTSPAVTLGELLVQSASAGSTGMIAELAAVPDEGPPDTMNADRYLALYLYDTSVPPETREYRRSLALGFAASDPAVLERIKRVMASPPEAPPPPVLETPEVPANDPLSAAWAAYDNGDEAKARKLYEKVLVDDPGNLQATYGLRIMDAPLNIDRVGVLLPLSGRFGAAGAQVQAAFEEGYNGPAELVFKDSGATPETAVAALESLVFEDGVIGVVGPLLTVETESVTNTMEAMRVPGFSLSQAWEPQAEAGWVVQGMLTPHAQIRALLDYAMTEAEMTTFGIFGPDTPYGHMSGAAFREEVEARGGTITVEEYYDPTATDLQPFAQTLGQKDYEERKWEYDKLKKAAEEAGRDPGKVVLPPIVEFEGLFVPESASKVPLVCAGLAYEEFKIRSSSNIRNSSGTIRLMGLSGWNNPSLVSGGGGYVRNAWFTDVFVPPPRGKSYAADMPAEWTDFVALHRENTGRTPSPLEAIARDAGAFLSASLNLQPASRKAFLQALESAELQDSITGAAVYEPAHRAISHQVRILTISDGSIKPVQP